jgi:hypothetical protein
VQGCAYNTIISGQMNDSCSMMVLQHADCYGHNTTATGSAYFLVGAQFCLGTTAIDFV